MDFDLPDPQFRRSNAQRREWKLSMLLLLEEEFNSINVLGHEEFLDNV